MQERDPGLFGSDTKAYSGSCQANVKRQPVILTEEEWQNIDEREKQRNKDQPKSFTNVIKYGSDSNKPYYYICPRYWCIPKNVSLSKEDIDNGECGGWDAIIPAKAKKVPPGKSIYEFNVPREHHDGKGNYIEHHPGFLKKDCIPCCFKNWNQDSQIKRRKECLDKPDKSKSAKMVKATELEEYIKSADKFPLEQNRWGILPNVLLEFLNQDKEKCKPKGPSIELNIPCLLRHGIENSKNQSFVGVIADIYVDYNDKTDEIPNIKLMKQIIINSITIDQFIKYYNGNIITLFKPKEVDLNINIEQYKTSLLWQQIEGDNEIKERFIKEIVNSLHQFIEYLKNDDIIIDYKYLWDVISTPNPRLFPKGINMFILEVTNSEDNIDIICPTTFYTNSWYSTGKRTLIVMKKNNYFEPIYNYKDDGNEISIYKLFSEIGILPTNLRESINKIRQYLSNCKNLNSQPENYTFKENVVLFEIIQELAKLKATILYGLIDYNGKVVGVHIKYNDLEGFIPCYPSSINLNYKYKFIYDYTWQPYMVTKQFLSTIKNINNEILCEPVKKIIDQDIIIGIITETNQFIQVIPEENIKDELEVMNDKNYILSDKETIFNKNKENDRINYIRKIKLEKNFFDVFRNILRIEINKYSNKVTREHIIHIINNNENYHIKLRQIKTLLKTLISDKVTFSTYNKELLKKIENVYLCDKNCTMNYCITTDEKTCVFMIPKRNIINNQDNEVIYYTKLADELIRYDRINSYIFNLTKYLTLRKTIYSLHPDEILILSSMITQDYFKDLTLELDLKYTYFNSYDTSNPNKTIDFTNKIVDTTSPTKKTCSSELLKIGGKWGKLFSPEFKEEKYNNTVECSFEIILQLIDSTIVNMKKILVERYNTINSEKLLYILKRQGKGTQVENIKNKLFTLEEYIMSELYYLTNIDIWILAEHFNIPIILISATKLLENSKSSLALVKDDSECIIIKVPPVHIKNSVGSYSLIKHTSYKIDLKLLNPNTKKILEENYMTLNEYIERINPNKKKLVLVK